MIDKEKQKEFEDKAGALLMKARQRCAMDHPFWSSFTVGKEWRVDWSVETAYTDGRRMGYNPAFLCYIYDKFKLMGVIAVIVHEAAHIFLCHHLRRQNRDPFQWNVACDHVINNMLVGCTPSMCLDGDWLCDRKYKNWGSEQVYEQERKNRKQQPQTEQGDGKPCDGGMGGQGGKDNPSPGQSEDGAPTKDAQGKYVVGEIRDMKNEDGSNMSEQEIDDAVQEIHGITVNAAQMAKKAGKLPASVREMVKDLLEPRVDWKDVLSIFVGERATNDFNMSKPRPTAACCGYFSPVMESEDVPAKIVVGVDTSGSMNFVEACSEVQGAVQRYEEEGVDTELKVVYCDTQIHHIEDLASDGHPFAKGKGGGGGTRFSPVTKWVQENASNEGLEGFVYITDGYCGDFGQDPGIPMLWILTEDSHSSFNPPFGDVVYTNIKGN